MSRIQQNSSLYFHNLPKLAHIASGVRMPVVYAIERLSENVWILWVFILLSLGISTLSTKSQEVTLFGRGLCNFSNIFNFKVGYGWLCDLLFWGFFWQWWGSLLINFVIIFMATASRSCQRCSRVIMCEMVWYIADDIWCHDQISSNMISALWFLRFHPCDDILWFHHISALWLLWFLYISMTSCMTSVTLQCSPCRWKGSGLILHTQASVWK